MRTRAHCSQACEAQSLGERQTAGLDAVTGTSPRGRDPEGFPEKNPDGRPAGHPRSCRRHRTGYPPSAGVPVLETQASPGCFLCSLSCLSGLIRGRAERPTRKAVGCPAAGPKAVAAWRAEPLRPGVPEKAANRPGEPHSTRKAQPRRGRGPGPGAGVRAGCSRGLSMAGSTPPARARVLLPLWSAAALCSPLSSRRRDAAPVVILSVTGRILSLGQRHPAVRIQDSAKGTGCEHGLGAQETPKPHPL